MNKILILLSITLITSSCIFPTKKATYTYPEKVQVDVYDNTRWNQGKGGGDLHQFITEATPKGQSLNDWKELITLQFYSKDSGNNTLEMHMYNKKNLLTNACPNINYTVISRSNTEAIYQWSIKQCKGHDDQFEVARFIKTENGIHRVSYSQKNSNPTQEDFDKWLYIINNARVVKI